MPSVGISTECLFVWEHYFLPSGANLRLAKHGQNNSHKSTPKPFGFDVDFRLIYGALQIRQLCLVVF
ncbi:MAG: hypothetical protein LBQ66_01415 [Planctomycetaceae bacterium]|nr:hypothetical protein [Planctomycetaceae bacterium]